MYKKEVVRVIVVGILIKFNYFEIVKRKVVKRSTEYVVEMYDVYILSFI